MKPTYFIKTVVLMLALIFFALMIARGLATFSANIIFKSVLFYTGIVLYTYIFAFISVSEQEKLKKEAAAKEILEHAKVIIASDYTFAKQINRS